MTLSSLHREFLRHCEVEKRLAPQPILASRSDFAQFLGYLLDGREGPSRQDSLRTFTTAGLRDYQRHMATQRWRTNTLPPPPPPPGPPCGTAPSWRSWLSPASAAAR